MTKRAFLFSAAGALGVVLLPGCRARAADAETFEISKTDEEWKRILSPAAFAVLREEDTERAGTSPLNKEHRPGIYRCAGCALPVFSSETKFESGTGWPSFWKPIDGAIRTRKEGIQYFIPATEVHCRQCGGHLGHVFDDGPPPTHLRYCINGIALAFKPQSGQQEKER
jgi:peptide-methionine (R)-S-oxide reductase